MKSEFIVSIDVGSTKVSILIGEVGAECSTLRIIGAGKAPCEGMKKGSIIDIEQVADSIRQAGTEAEKMAGVEIHGVCASVSGNHIRSFNSRGVIAIPTSRREVTRKDIERVTDAARNITLPSDMEILHAIPQDFVVDNQRDIRDPVGMSALRLEAEVHIVTALCTQIENFAKAFKKAGLDLINMVFEPLATGRAVLLEEEMESGCLLIDMGGGVTSYALYHGGCVRSSGIIAAGGANITNDLAIGLRTPVSTAETLKKAHGVALASLAGEDDVFEVPGTGMRPGREVRRQVAAAIIEPRAEEIFTMIKKAISSDPFHRLLGGGAVLTGGSSRMPGMDAVAEQVLDLPVRLGTPFGLDGLAEIVNDEGWSCGVGLLVYERDSLDQAWMGEGIHGRGLGWVLNRIRKIASLF
jgi:cell division protein FtsA